MILKPLESRQCVATGCQLTAQHCSRMVEVAMTHEGAMRQCYMLFGTRVVVQGIRLVWVPLLVYIAQDLQMSTLKTGSVLSSFSLGYLSTQVVGGMAADKYGGKPVQTLTLCVMTAGMLLAPAAASAGGATGLWFIYMLMGLFSGPQHPAYNTMVAEWFSQEELGSVSSICEAGPVLGNLIALLVGPTLAAAYGWRTAYYCFGIGCAVWTAIWYCVARSSPAGSKAGVGKQPSSEPSARFPWRMASFVSVWAVVCQHTVFNGTKYFFADWMPAYFATVFGDTHHPSPAV